MLLYHGSPKRVSVLKPMNMHGDTGIGDVIFATPDKTMALAYAGRKWGDRDINQSYNSDTGRWALTEMRPLAFNDAFFDACGYVYMILSSCFPDFDGEQRVIKCDKEISPFCIESIDNVMRALVDANVYMVQYDENSEAFSAAVLRMKNRIMYKHDSEKEMYLRWVAEKNTVLWKKLTSE